MAARLSPSSPTLTVAPAAPRAPATITSPALALLRRHFSAAGAARLFRVLLKLVLCAVAVSCAGCGIWWLMWPPPATCPALHAPQPALCSAPAHISRTLGLPEQLHSGMLVFPHFRTAGHVGVHEDASFVPSVDKSSDAPLGRGGQAPALIQPPRARDKVCACLVHSFRLLAH